MSIETLPVYKDLFSLEKDEILQIQNKCIEKNHLSEGEDLLELIKTDKQILELNGLKPIDIYNNHRNMSLLYRKTDQFDKYNSKANMKEIIGNYRLPNGFGNGWCSWGISSNEILINEQHLLICNTVWGGAELCPIESSFTDKYMGYQRGDSDWFVINIKKNMMIHVPDLLPAQIGMFCFFQGIKSQYRLDLEKYISIFGLDTHKCITIVPTIIKHQWSYGSGPFAKSDQKYYAISYSKNINEYEATLCVEKNKILEDLKNCKTDTIDEKIKNIAKKDLVLYLKIEDIHWFHMNKDMKINIYGYDLNLSVLDKQTYSPEHTKYDNGYHRIVSRKLEARTYLAENDQTEQIEKKASTSCIQQ